MGFFDGHLHHKESVRDYPRTPRVEDTGCRIRVVLGNAIVAESTNGKRVVEQGHPPVYYIPQSDIRPGCLWDIVRNTPCGPKGLAKFYDVVAGQKHARCAAWTYPEPTDGFEDLEGYIAFYPGKMDGCYVDNERVRPEPSDLYGGWITSNIVGPFVRHNDYTSGP